MSRRSTAAAHGLPAGTCTSFSPSEHLVLLVEQSTEEQVAHLLTRDLNQPHAEGKAKYYRFAQLAALPKPPEGRTRL